MSLHFNTFLDYIIMSSDVTNASFLFSANYETTIYESAKLWVGA